MNTINTNTFGVQRKNQQNIKKLFSLINDYESKLDNKVDDLVNHIITYSKKCQDSLTLPQINPNNNTNTQIKSKSHSKTFSIIKSKNTQNNHYRQKSIHSASYIHDVDQNMQQKINILKKSVVNSSKKIYQNILPQGRSLGNKKIIKPRFLKKQADIVPRQIRLDPFSQKNIIKAYQLDKGIINLIQRGKIGKDVDIITAFQKGGNILNTKQAIFHNGQQKVTKNIPLRSYIKNKNQTIQQSYSKRLNQISKFQQQYEQNNWAITMPDTQLGLKFNNKEQSITSLNQYPTQQLFKNIIYLKFIHYNVIQNQDFKKISIINIEYLSEINQLIKQMSNLLQKYTIQIAYVDSNKLLDLCTILYKVKQSQLISTILSFKNHRKIPLKQIINKNQQKLQAVKKIQSFSKKIIYRKQFLLYLKKKITQVKIYNWLYNVKIRKNFKQSIKIFKQQTIQKFNQIQQNFKHNYNQIINKKHYQIHISNKSIEGKAAYKEYLNTQITRIFNFQNSLTHIIILLSQSLSEQTKNYYYKIMELQEIPNFKQRVTFIHIKNYSYFTSNKFNCSQKLYYDSNLIRQLKHKIGNNPAYFRISYPTKTDIHMSSFLKIPIYTGKLQKLLEIQKRSFNNELFELPELKSYKIIPNTILPLTLATQMIKFCQNNKRYKNYIVKINECYQSSGIGLLTYPFDSLPGIYSNTAFISNSQNLSPSQFYRKLCKKGGIIQVFQQSLSSIIILGKINNDGKSQIVGTYDKISYGFVNVGYFFPSVTLPQNQIYKIFNSVSQKLVNIGHFGDFQLSLFIDEKLNVYFDKIQCYQTQIGSSLFYFKFLCKGKMNTKGEYMTQIVQTFQGNQNKQQEIITIQPRNYFYLPYILHFGLSEKQTGSFFQLCRIGGISFDLQNKFGSTFILLGSLKNSMGLITTAKDRQTCQQLMLKSLNFIIKQNSHNNSNQFMIQKQKRMKQRQNIYLLKQRIQNL